MDKEKSIKTVKSRQSILWHYVDLLINAITDTGATYDEKFMELLEPLQTYVSNKIILPEDELIDIYVVVESYASIDNE